MYICIHIVIVIVTVTVTVRVRVTVVVIRLHDSNNDDATSRATWEYVLTMVNWRFKPLTRKSSSCSMFKLIPYKTCFVI